MRRSELIAQYYGFISQLREEVKEFYWFYNLFFLIESALISLIITEGLKAKYLLITHVIGLLLSIYWLWVLNKQKLWRDEWLSKIKNLENQLKYPEKLQMWTEDKSDFIAGKNGLWRLLSFLPIGFIILWLILAL